MGRSNRFSKSSCRTSNIPSQSTLPVLRNQVERHTGYHMSPRSQSFPTRSPSLLLYFAPNSNDRILPNSRSRILVIRWKITREPDQDSTSRYEYGSTHAHRRSRERNRLSCWERRHEFEMGRDWRSSCIH